MPAHEETDAVAISEQISSSICFRVDFVDRIGDCALSVEKNTNHRGRYSQVMTIVKNTYKNEFFSR